VRSLSRNKFHARRTAGYDSSLEKFWHEKHDDGLSAREPVKLDYVKHGKYKPDFGHRREDGRWDLAECKGMYRGADAVKMQLALSQNVESIASFNLVLYQSHSPKWDRWLERTKKKIPYIDFTKELI
jgi:hypothetical protein